MVFAQGLEENREPKQTHSYMEAHYKVALLLQTRREMNFRWNVNLDVKVKTFKLLEKNMGEYFYILRVRKDFSKHMKQGKKHDQITKEKIRIVIKY